MSHWAQWSPATRRRVVWLGVTALLLAAVTIFVLQTEEAAVRRRPVEPLRNVLTDKDPRSLGTDSLMAEIRVLQKQLADATKDIAALQTGQRSTSLTDEVTRLREELQRVTDQYRELEEDLRRLPERLAASRPAAPPPGPAKPPAGPDATPPAGPPAAGREPAAPAGPGTRLGLPGSPALPTPRGPGRDPAPLAPDSAGTPLLTGTLPPAARPTPKIRVVEATALPAPAADRPVAGRSAVPAADPTRLPTRSVATAPAASDRDTNFYLPAGSILSGTLLTGLDAATGQGAQDQPMPSLLRIDLEALLPNRFRADLRECFLLAGGYGSLSAERAYLRAETLSCIRRDGEVLEVALDGYASGEDGKAGLRGRVVSKQGQVLARAMQAGFLEAFAKIFQKQPVATVATGTPGADVAYQSNLTGEAVGSAALAGVGGALGKLANFYTKMAEEMFPVIEINTGRQIHFILVRGIGLKLT